MALKLLATESSLMKRVMGSLPLNRDGEKHAVNETRNTICHNKMDFFMTKRDLKKSWKTVKRTH